MSRTVCLAANTLHYMAGGGHIWVYLNWALGLRKAGCRVIWLEIEDSNASLEKTAFALKKLKHCLDRYGFSEDVVLVPNKNRTSPSNLVWNSLSVDEVAGEVDLLLAIRHDLKPEFVRRFRRSAMIDIDPGILQFWMEKGVIKLAPFDVYFTIGETVGKTHAKFGDGGVQWEYTPPCVDLSHWNIMERGVNAAFTTVSHWYMAGTWMGGERDGYNNEKRAGFLPYLTLPQLTTHPLELALHLAGDTKEQLNLERLGWRICEAHGVASNPWDYHKYIQNSIGEFSCAKPSCIRLENAWISDRTICYLASGKPAVVQYTGQSRFLPDAEGLFRFRNLKEATQFIERAMKEYERQCRLARALAEEHFDARKVVHGVLDRMLG